MKRFSNCIVKLTQSKLPSQLGFRGHLLAKSQMPDQLLTLSLPKHPQTLSDSIHIVLINTTTGNKEAYISQVKKIFNCRRHVIRDWLTFLKQHHQSYKDLEIDMVALNAFPENDMPEIL